ncbi:ABC transporter substrate-binding protein [Kosmotoga arenicorallina S304]|uniref:ABC transporter substrate-binding protein n=1 Tax=Kosmotoga arenicorallina S304 TaxID=1453497 RepID=A0A182C836_9BACT|nr:extracellular solute-binding protein [Kosmotoga arenicorallina]OAA31938.1 ABC transporter substrate-binding protein [Kosmotoga arenicorallina S304]
MQRLLLKTIIATAIILLMVLLVYAIGKIEYSKYQQSILKKTSDSELLSPEEIKLYFEGLQSSFDGVIVDSKKVLKINKTIESDEETSVDFELESSGDFFIICRVAYPEKTTTNGFLELTVNGEVFYQIIIDTFTYYDYTAIAFDRYGNEIVPEQYIYSDPIYSYFKDAKRVSGKPVLFSFKAGKNNLLIKNLRSRIEIEEIYLLPSTLLQDVPEYEDYLRKNGFSTEQGNGSENILKEAENLLGKSDFFISINNLQIPVITPYEVLKKKINVVDQNTFKYSGQKITWVIDVDKPGFYKVGLRYQQNLNRGVPVFRRIYVNGKVPFSEVSEYPFEYTEYAWKDKIISDESGTPYYFYLKKGINYISLEVTTGIYENTITFLQDSVRKIQNIALDIRKLIGVNLDENRTWNIEKYMPNVIEELETISSELKAQHQQLIDVVGKKGLASISEMLVVADLIDKILKNSNRLPFYLDELSEGSASAVQRLSELSMRLKEQPLGLDKLYVFQGEMEYSFKSTSMFFISAYEEIQKLWLSLLNKNEAYSIYEESAEQNLRIWVNRPVQYVETLQYLIDTDFTPKTGIDVTLSVMQNEQRLILASSSGRTPDAALGISSWLPFELAIRSALYPLSNFEDFFDFASENINIETLLPMVVEDKVYGITETQNFYVLFYRKDILEKLNVPIPDSWDDVKKILPELQRRGLNFYIPMCEQTIKYFNTTAPFFFQNDARLYSKDGIKTALNEDNSIKAFELMTELFSIYGLPEQVANFYNAFRYGRIPIGVGDFGLYVALSNAADEIYGLWDIAPSPGVVSADGKVERYQVASDRTAIIFKNAKNKDKAWVFLKWWLSKETQLKFARTLITRYGPAYMWNTANIQAFKELEFFEEYHKRAILEQWKWIREVQRHPGGYMVEREVSNVWNRVVIEGYPLRPSIDRSVIIVNRELERKLTEFGYLQDGIKVKDYIMYDTMEEFLIENLGNDAYEYLMKARKLRGEIDD